MPGVRFRLRPSERRELRLAPVEVAVIEVLRDPAAVEATDAELRDRIAELIDRGAVRPGLLAEEIADERHVGARHRWQELDLVT